MTGAAGPRKGRPRVCPNCGSSRIADIQYGEPPASASLEADIEAGRVVLGGCCLTEDSPRYCCLSCGTGLGELATSAVTEYVAPDAFAAAVLPDGSLSQPRVVGRLVLTGDAASKRLRPDPALLLEAACEELARRQARVRYLVTPAGFIKLRLAPGQARTHGWKTEPEDFKTLIDIATYEVSRLLADSVLADRLTVDRSLTTSSSGSISVRPTTTGGPTVRRPSS